MSGFCDPTWHRNRRVPADYRVTGVERTSDKFAPDSTYKTIPAGWDDTHRWVTCAAHLDRAVARMLEGHQAVIVTREAR